MTDTEKILNLLEINENISALVIDEDSNIVSGNFSWSKLFHSHESGKNFYKYFDKNTSLLVKNSVLDAKTFSKIQERDINIEVDGVLQNFNLLISPFKLDKKLYYYILLIDKNPVDELIVFPTLDINSETIKYRKIIDMLKESLPNSLVEKKNFQYEIDIEKEPIAIKDNVQYIFTNKCFNNKYELSDTSNTILISENIFSKKLLTKIKLAENEIYNTKSAFIIEEKILKNNAFQLINRILLLPLLSKENSIESIIIIGSNASESDPQKQPKEFVQTESSKTSTQDFSKIDNAAEAKIIYDRNNYDILDANFIAAKLYGYNLEEFKGMNITELFPPEEMQKLLMHSEERGSYILNQLKSDGNIISVNVQKENIIWKEKEACLETINLNQPEEEVIELEDEPEKQLKVEEKEVVTQAVNESKGESKSEFFSSLFHEILTPVNVILGFVQEIIDSLDNPTEEQKESAQIIKDNQQILLQTMNTAAQYAQLDENKIKLKIEEFDLNKYLVDLNDSYSRDVNKANIKVVFEDIPDSLILKHDRAKLLAAISYLIKFILKLTKSSKIYLSIKVIDEKLHFLVKDSEKRISENVANDLLEIFNNYQISKKKNYGISPISIKLAILLNKLLSVSIKEFYDLNDIRTIALVTTISFDKSKETLKPEAKNIEISSELEYEGSKKEQIFTKTEVDDEIIDETEIESDVIHEIEQDIPNGEVDEKIVEDIEDEEEIVTEEIATLEESEKQIAPQEIISQVDEDVEPSNLAELSCLFIDDSVDAQLLFKSQMNGFKQLKISPNLSEALPLLNKYNFDLIIVDIHLNDKYNGLDALKIIRQFNNYKDTPIFAVTAFPFEKDREKFLSFGFTDYFIKPLLKEQLINSLKKVLS